LCLSRNPNALHLLENNQHKIFWNYWLLVNPNIIYLLEKNQDKIDWEYISENESIFELDYASLKERCSIYKEELIQIALHPSRISKYLEEGIEMGKLDNYI